MGASLEGRGNEDSKVSRRNMVLAGSVAVERMGAYDINVLARVLHDGIAEFARVDGGNRSVEEDPQVHARAAARPLEVGVCTKGRGRSGACPGLGDRSCVGLGCTSFAGVAFAVEVHRQKPHPDVNDWVESNDVAELGILAAKMGLDRFVIKGLLRFVLAVVASCAARFALWAHAALPEVLAH